MKSDEKLKAAAEFTVGKTGFVFCELDSHRFACREYDLPAIDGTGRGTS